MKHSFLLRFICGMTLSLIMITQPASAAHILSQTIQLNPGWNAVFLEIAPDDPDLDSVFDGKPVDRVVAYYPMATPVQYIQDPDEIDWKKDAWHRWTPPVAPDAFANNLYSLQANQAYLIHAVEEVTLTLSGEPKARAFKWRPDSFNFTGFHIDPANPPTFDQYFNGSEAHADFQIFHLLENQWTQVARPDEAAIIPGKAYWVYCRGGSDYPGPLAVSLGGAGDRISFQKPVYGTDFELINRSDGSLTVDLEMVPNPEGPDLPLFIVERSLSSGDMVYNPLTTDGIAFDLSSREERTVRLAVKIDALGAYQVSNLIRITDSEGGQLYIPAIYEQQ